MGLANVHCSKEGWLDLLGLQFLCIEYSVEATTISTADHSGYYHQTQWVWIFHKVVGSHHDVLLFQAWWWKQRVGNYCEAISEVCRMAMGLKPSPNFVQLLIEQVLADLDVDVYIDNIATLPSSRSIMMNTSIRCCTFWNTCKKTDCGSILWNANGPWRKQTFLAIGSLPQEFVLGRRRLTLCWKCKLPLTPRNSDTQIVSWCSHLLQYVGVALTHTCSTHTAYGWRNFCLDTWMSESVCSCLVLSRPPRGRNAKQNQIAERLFILKSWQVLRRTWIWILECASSSAVVRSLQQICFHSLQTNQICSNASWITHSCKRCHAQWQCRIFKRISLKMMLWMLDNKPNWMGSQQRKFRVDTSYAIARIWACLQEIGRLQFRNKALTMFWSGIMLLSDTTESIVSLTPCRLTLRIRNWKSNVQAGYVL